MKVFEREQLCHCFPSRDFSLERVYASERLYIEWRFIHGWYSEHVKRSVCNAWHSLKFIGDLHAIFRLARVVVNLHPYSLEPQSIYQTFKLDWKKKGPTTIVYHKLTDIMFLAPILVLNLCLKWHDSRIILANSLKMNYWATIGFYILVI